MPPTPSRSLLERLADGPVICAEGYLFELERRGYLQAGAFVPDVVLEFPEAVEALHREFVRAGSDVVEALTYYAHREKLRLVEKEHLLEPLQKNALALAHKVADNAPTDERPLVAGNVCNTNAWELDGSTDKVVREMFDEQVAMAQEANVDFMIGETFSHLGEARIALASIKKAGLTAVITMIMHQKDEFWDGVPIEEGVRILEKEGADVVGLNCGRGPETLIPVLSRVRDAVDCPVAALPVPYRTKPGQPTFQSLRDPDGGEIPNGRPFPVALDPFTCSRYEMAAFARWAVDNGINYVGVCCGGAPHHIRAMAEELGKTAPASAYSPDMSKHFAFGTHESLRKHHTDNRENL